MHSFRTQLLATTAILALSGAAYAADMPVKAAPPPMAPPIIPWTGFYAGLQVGGASFEPSCHSPFSQADETEIGFFADPCNSTASNKGSPDGEGVSGSLNSASVIGGGKIGYDYQWGWAVFGVVGEFDWTHLSSSQTVQFADPIPFANNTASDRINWLASARGRIGWTFGQFDNFLAYFTGGVAWTQIKTSISFAGFGLGIDDVVVGCPTLCGSGGGTSDKTGGVAGAGFEYRVSPHVSVVGEVLWYGFGSTNASEVIVGHTYTTTFDHQDVVSGTLGVNWRF